MEISGKITKLPKVLVFVYDAEVVLDGWNSSLKPPKSIDLSKYLETPRGDACYLLTGTINFAQQSTFEKHRFEACVLRRADHPDEGRKEEWVHFADGVHYEV